MKFKHKYIRILFLLIALVVSSTVNAQEDLRINSIFKKYGKQKGATMVVMSGKVLKDYDLSKYRSITINYDKAIFNEIQECIEDDKEGAHKIKEIINNGVIVSAYYQLISNESKINKYILFNVDNNHKATLIYMEGGINSDVLIEKLFLKQK